jgi:hypothetical protein
MTESELEGILLRYHTFQGLSEIFSAPKNPKQFPLLLLLEPICLREGKALGSEKVKGYDAEFYEHRREVKQGHCCL